MDETAITKQGFTYSELSLFKLSGRSEGWRKEESGSIPDGGIPAMRLAQVPI
jgi:hypothetical protein